MTELFTAITLEVLINGVWIDLWPDVVHPSVKGKRGISSNGLNDRVGDAGELSFTLRNDEWNSAGLEGYYSPGHSNCLSGWTTSLPVRLGLTYDTWTRYKWAGRITPDGIQVSPGTNATRRVDVLCEDFMGTAARHRMNLMTAQYDKYFHEAIQLVLDNMPVQPAAIRVVDRAGTSSGVLPFPFMFDISGVETTALGEFQKMATSVAADGATAGNGYIVIQGDGINGECLFATYILQDTGENPDNVRGFLPTPTALASQVIREDNADFILLESGDFLLREGGSNAVNELPPTGDEIPNFVDIDIGADSSFLYGKDIANQITIVHTPRKIDAEPTSILWTLDRAMKIDPLEQVTIRGAYNDPVGGAKVNGIEFVTPVANTDYAANSVEAGTATDMTAFLGVSSTFGSAEVELILSNSHSGTALYVGGTVSGAMLQVRGKGVYTYDVVRQVTSDAESIKRHGVQPITIDSPYVNLNDVLIASGGTFGESLLAHWKDPRISIDNLSLYANRDVKNMVSFMFLEPRWEVDITEGMNGLDGATYTIQGFDFEFKDAQNVFWNIMLKGS